MAKYKNGTQSCEQLSTKLSVLEAQDTSGLFASVTALTGEKATLEAELKAARDLIARLEEEKKAARDLLVRLEEEQKEEKKQINERLLEQSKLAQQATGLQAEVDGYKREIGGLKATLEHFKREDSKKTDSTLQLVAVAKRTQEKLDETQTRLDESRDEIHQLSRGGMGLDDSKIDKPKKAPAAEPKKGGMNTTADPARFLAPRDTVPVNSGGNGQLQRKSIKGATGAQPPQAAFFSQQPSQQPPAPDLLKLEEVYLPVSETETTNKENILKCIQKTTKYNVVSPIRLKALVALGRFLSALPAIDETDSVCKFALDSVKKLASHEAGSPNSPSQCLKEILESELPSVTVTSQQAPSFEHLKAELTALSKEPARNSMAENLKDIRLLQGLGVLFHNDVGFNVPLLKEHFKSEKAKYTPVASNASDRSQDVFELQRSNMFGSEGTGPDSFNY